MDPNKYKNTLKRNLGYSGGVPGQRVNNKLDQIPPTTTLLIKSFPLPTPLLIKFFSLHPPASLVTAGAGAAVLVASYHGSKTEEVDRVGVQEARYDTRAMTCFPFSIFSSTPSSPFPPDPPLILLDCSTSMVGGKQHDGGREAIGALHQQWHR